MSLGGDRRKQKRVPVHCAVYLFREPGIPPAESTTENLSSEGLYCITKERFKPGERLQCEVVIPAPFGFESPIVLQCHLTIRRVEYLRHGFGLGCRIDDYSLRSPI